MIRFHDVHLRFGEKILFQGLSWSIPDRCRVGLVGRNGAGKTTLLRILNGEQEPDSGGVDIPGNPVVGYLPQDLMELGQGPLIAYLKRSAGIEDIENCIRNCEESLNREAGNEKACLRLMEEHDRLYRRFQAVDGFTFEARAQKILSGLGFRPGDHQRVCEEFSGGWKMRVLLAAILLRAPQIMLLDEPTNHLDTESMEWLESYLRDYPGTIITISHDRRFLDNITTETAELSLGKITVYRGNYTYYLETSAVRREAQEKQHKLQQEEIKKTQEFIERFRYKATKAKQVQSRVRQLEKMEVVEIESDAPDVVMAFPECPRSGHEVVAVHDVAKSYDGLTVFKDVSFTAHRGEKIALVGVNGAGKSTLSRLISLQEEPSVGEVTVGHNVEMGFFSQESARNLDYRRTVWEEVKAAGGNFLDARRRDLLGAFLFRGEEIHKPIPVLSGGEKSRLALLKLLLMPTNFLILDEPTNHLDIATKELFQRALLQYTGTLVIVSHDRYFLDNLVERVVEIRDGSIRSYPGNYTYFIEKRAKDREVEPLQDTGREPSHTVQKPALSAREHKRLEAERRNRLYKKTQVIRKELDPLEKKIQEMEDRKTEIEGLLCAPEVLADSGRVRGFMVELGQVNENLESLMPRWEELMEELEEVEASE